MQSPFPGMDPFLEGHLWPDFHNTLAIYIKAELIPLLHPKYLVQTVVYTVLDTEMEADVGIMYPDVSIFQKKQTLKESSVAYDQKDGPPATPPTIIIREMPPVEVKIPLIEIRDQKNRNLVAAIEILSPVNKRSPGIEPYRKKRKRLHEAGVHLLEIDLLRRGQRIIRHNRLPHSHYLISLWRVRSPGTEIWAINIKDPLPIIPIPLTSEDQDVVLDLGKVFKETYQTSRYEASINYMERPPPPTFSKEEEQWMAALFKKDDQT